MFQEEVETAEGRWYLMRLLPYRAVDGQVEGVVLTFAASSRATN
jgi:two-component system CheB/CheR fusion protein